MLPSQNTKLPDLEIQGVDLATACDLIEDMGELHKHDTGNMIVYSGKSEKFGLVHIILPAIGNPIILPWLSQVFTTDNQEPLNTHSTAET